MRREGQAPSARILIRGEAASRRVWIDGRELRPDRSQNLWNHSPDGFNWGYGGSGPAQLALAILLELTDRQTAISWHQDFKWGFVARLPEGDFEAEIPVAWIARIEAMRRMVPA